LLEVEAVVADYFAMLTKQISGVAYNKTVHRNGLSQLLAGRSDGSIERKHQNISAVLIELGCPYIFGYKPLGNYQRLLGEVISSRVATDPVLRDLVEAAVAAPAGVPSIEDILSRLERPPIPKKIGYSKVKENPSENVEPLTGVNYLEREARNASLGLAGELFVLNFERARLILSGRENLAESVEHVPVTQGDGLGFDIRSFELDGSDRFIEVKTTAYGKQTPFFLSSNELRTSRKRHDRYHLYRTFRFRDDPRLFVLSGPLDTVCTLEPVQYRGRVA
jgi:hypothetical protein